MGFSNLKKIKFIPSYTLPTAFADTLSYIELIGKMTKSINDTIESIQNFGVEIENKLNEQDNEIEAKFNEQDSQIVEYYNQLVDRTNSYIKQVEQMYANFVNEVNAGILEFQRNVDIDIENFKSDINGTVEEQNVAIANAVDYMKNNIDSVASSIVTERISNGEIFVNLVYDSNTRDLSLKLADSESSSVVEVDSTNNGEESAVNE